MLGIQEAVIDKVCGFSFLVHLSKSAKALNNEVSVSDSIQRSRKERHLSNADLPYDLFHTLTGWFLSAISRCE